MKIQLILSILIIALITSCSKENTNCDNSIDCLPEATQIGNNTAGCLVNGDILLPSGQSLNSGSVLKAQYKQHVNQDDYLFSIAIMDLKRDERSIFISLRGIKLEENKTYILKDNDSNSYGAYLTEYLEAYSTSNQNLGEIHISKLDESKKIISGTFWFDGINNENELIEIRNGRFDVIYW